LDSPSSSGSELPPDHDPHSSFRLEITLSIGYERKRALLGTKWEGPIVTLALALGGIIVVLLFLWTIARWAGLL
jgi:hypothetical protein